METLPGSKKNKKKKVLLMGKSGSGKSSMRSIIFSNYVAKDTRRLGATIDVEHSHVRFLGNLTLNLWDCGGQDAFVENYLNTQRAHVFSNVGVLIYVFDVESREFNRDVVTFSAIMRALKEYSSGASVFCLIHKMDLVQDNFRTRVYDDRVNVVKEKSEGFDATCFATSIWDQSLYKAWSNIIHTLVPNLSLIEAHLQVLAEGINAEEIILFERTTFLVVTSVTNHTGKMNPMKDRFERLSSIIKTFKQSLSKYTSLPRASAQFVHMRISNTKCNLFIARFTQTTYVLVVVPPGECNYNGAVLNTQIARDHFEKVEELGLASTRSTGDVAGSRGGAGDGHARANEAGETGEAENSGRVRTGKGANEDDSEVNEAIQCLKLTE
ncbi:MAG: GTP-binding protein gtr1 [Piccolia ochrophora]|nr:MAG: GTP-binding protein gtr1 [Piccolia ochrophora]